MNASKALDLLREGKEITITRKVTSSFGSIALTVSTVIEIAGQSLTDVQFKAIRKRHKLSLNADKSTPARTVYNLRTL